jgi:hypothetical protein
VSIGIDGVLRKPEIVGTGEILKRAIHAPGGNELFGAHGPQPFAELVADEILSTVAAGEREIRRPHMPAAREPRNQERILIVRMRADDEHTRVDAEAQHGLPQSNGAALL